MALVKGRKIVYRALESGIFSLHTNNYYSEQ